MQAPGTYAERLAQVRHLAATGWNVSSGFIAGLPGQSEEELLENFTVAGALPLRGCSVSPFIPGEATPFASAPMADIELTLNCMAALRLMRPDWVIPAVSALNLAAPDAGYRRGLRTGANLVTINMTPDDLREDYLLYKRDRFTCQYCGIQPGSEELTVDHVLPRSRSGTSTWENCVLACVDCNHRKADRTPDEAGMPLRKLPIKPAWNPFYSRQALRIESWSRFLSESYWSVELDA